MAVTVEDVKVIAQLAKLEFSEAEQRRFIEPFNQILAYVEQLNELDLDAVEPTTHVVELHNVLREDQVLPGLPREQLLENAPQHKEGLFSVPKVIG